MTGPLATVSPLARAIRLGREIRCLRESLNLSQVELARKAEIGRPSLSRIETPPLGEVNRRADVRQIRAVLLACGLADGTPQHQELMRLAWDSTQYGWWNNHPGMGAAQQITANAECGAVRICEYQITLVPGLAQTASYSRFRSAVAVEEGLDPDAVMDGRLRRQQALEAGGAVYQLILEELALRRPVAPTDVRREQLLHLLELGARPNVDIRIMPVETERLETGYVPTSPFSVYQYPEPADPTIVLLDMVAVHEPPVEEGRKVNLYVQLFRQLCDAALSTSDSAAAIEELARGLAK